ncbi:MAG: MBL fold metallo-hydrolase [Oscillospiraceae bacterium]|nr:MBL fold metallo-hydrolase [Oscillospiraceae bacterium]
MMESVYYAKYLGDGLYAIAEKHHPDNHHYVMMYLVIGEKKAALIDCGFGVVDSLRTFVEKLTDKPIVCLIAHGHPDHAGAAALFDEIYMNPKDEVLLPVSLSYQRRMDDVFGGRGLYGEGLKEYCEKHIVLTEKLYYKPMKDGDVFDLGGKQLEVVAIPGHTPGSVAIMNRAENYALTSDCFSVRTALVKMPPEKRLGLTLYRDGLARFMSMIDENTKIYWGHHEAPMEHEIPLDMLHACNNVLDGKTENDVPSNSPFSKRLEAQGTKMMEHTHGRVILVYNANTL